MLRKLFFGAVAAAIAAFAVISTQLAFAHSRPIRFDPAPGAVLASAPAKIDGWFTAEIRRDPNWSFLHVTDGQGNRVDTGDTQLSADRRQMTVNLRSGLAPGGYIVTWRTFDDGDGAIFGDCYTFFVGPAAADAAVNAKLRLDGGRACERIDVSARDGTPAPGQTPAVAATSAAANGHEGEGEATSGDGDDGLPVWALVLGVAGGLIVGGVGGRLVGRRS